MAVVSPNNYMTWKWSNYNKRQRLAKRCLQETHFKYKQYRQVENKMVKDISHNNQKKAGLALVV